MRVFYVFEKRSNAGGSHAHIVNRLEFIGLNDTAAALTDRVYNALKVTYRERG